MHELSVCQNIFQSLEEALPADDLCHLHEIHLDIGILSGIEPLYLQSAFELLTAGTSYANVRLVIARKQVVVECHHCGQRFTVAQQRFVCPECDQASANVVEGNELKITQVVIKEPQENET
jgi:hydrogenase nickel incorporation protein HypA/HybF